MLEKVAYASKLFTEFFNCYGLEHEGTVRLASAYQKLINDPTPKNYLQFIVRHFKELTIIAEEEEEEEEEE